MAQGAEWHSEKQVYKKNIHVNIPPYTLGASHESTNLSNVLENPKFPGKQKNRPKLRETLYKVLIPHCNQSTGPYIIGCDNFT